MDTSPGELANFCPACPQPGVNLTPEWVDDPNRWIYKHFFVADRNFKADHVWQRNPGWDVSLSEGGGMTSRRRDYEYFLHAAVEQSTVSVLIPSWQGDVNDVLGGVSASESTMSKQIQSY